MMHELKLVTNPEEVQRLYKFIKQFPLNYPNYFGWLDKCKKQLELGEKQAFYTSLDNRITGSIVFQRHREEPAVLEIKNFRVAEEYRGRGIGTGLEAMTCSFGRSNGFKKIQIDTNHSNFEMLRFLVRRG